MMTWNKAPRLLSSLVNRNRSCHKDSLTDIYPKSIWLKYFDKLNLPDKDIQSAHSWRWSRNPFRSCYHHCSPICIDLGFCYSLSNKHPGCHHFSNPRINKSWRAISKFLNSHCRNRQDFHIHHSLQDNQYGMDTLKFSIIICFVINLL